MKCPQCDQEMMSGYLQSDKIMAFNKHIHKLSLLPKVDEDVLIVRNLFNASNFNGHICKNCKLVVFDYSNPKAKEK